MTISEFRAWFEGFTENIPDVPTQKQWARICRKVKDIDAVPTTSPVFIERYFQPISLTYPWQPTREAGSTIANPYKVVVGRADAPFLT